MMITQEQMELLDLCKKHNTTYELANVYTGISIWSLRRLWKKDKKRIKKALVVKRKSLEAHKDNILYLRSMGVSHQNIADFYGFTKGAVVKFCKKYNTIPRKDLIFHLLSLK